MDKYADKLKPMYDAIPAHVKKAATYCCDFNFPLTAEAMVTTVIAESLRKSGYEAPTAIEIGGYVWDYFVAEYDKSKALAKTETTRVSLH